MDMQVVAAQQTKQVEPPSQHESIQRADVYGTVVVINVDRQC